MRRLARNRPSPSMIVALIALFVALSGASYAALSKNSVGSKQLKKNAVTTAKIKSNAVTGAKVGDGTIEGVDVKDASIGSPDLTDGSVGLSDLGANSVNGSKVADGSLGGQDVTDGSLGAGDVAAGTFLGGSVTVQRFMATSELADGGETSIDSHCLEGETALGGGARGDLTNSEGTNITSSRPIISTSNSGAPTSGGTFTGWRATVINPTGGVTTGIFPEVWVICAKLP